MLTVWACEMGEAAWNVERSSEVGTLAGSYGRPASTKTLCVSECAHAHARYSAIAKTVVENSVKHSCDRA